MKRVAIVLLMMLVSLAAPRTVGARTLTLDSFISETILNNPTVRNYIQQYVQSKGEYFAARGIDDVQFESLFSLAKRENPQLSGFDSTEDKQVAWEIGASKIISPAGTRISAKYSDSWTRSAYPNIVIGGFILTPITPLYVPSITLSLTQPLLKNIAGIQDRLNLTVREIQTEAARLNYEENIEQFISEMSQLYLRWLNAHENAKTFERVYHKISQQVGLIRDEVEAKVAEESDLYRALEQQALYKAAWEGYLADYESTTKEIAAMMQPDNPPSDIRPAKTRGSFIDKKIDEGPGLVYLKNESRLRGILDLSLDVEEAILRANKNARLPNLDFFTTYRRHGANPDFGRSHGSAFNNDDISGGLQFSVPITNREARGTYRAQAAKAKGVRYQNERTMLNATSRLEALYKKKYRLVKQVRAYERQFEFGRKKLKEELDQYEDGRLTLFQLLQDQTTHLSNSVDLEGARTQLAQTRLQINELTDQSLASFQGVIDQVVGEEGE